MHELILVGTPLSPGAFRCAWLLAFNRTGHVVCVNVKDIVFLHLHIQKQFKSHAKKTVAESYRYMYMYIQWARQCCSYIYNPCICTCTPTNVTLKSSRGACTRTVCTCTCTSCIVITSKEVELLFRAELLVGRFPLLVGGKELVSDVIQCSPFISIVLHKAIRIHVRAHTHMVYIYIEYFAYKLHVHVHTSPVKAHAIKILPQYWQVCHWSTTMLVT